MRKRLKRQDETSRGDGQSSVQRSPFAPQPFETSIGEAPDRSPARSIFSAPRSDASPSHHPSQASAQTDHGPSPDLKLQLKQAQRYGFKLADIDATVGQSQPRSGSAVAPHPVQAKAEPGQVIQARFTNREDLIERAGPPNKGAYTKEQRDNLTRNAGGLFNWSRWDPIWRTSKRYVKVLNALAQYTEVIGESSGLSGTRNVTIRSYLDNQEIQLEIAEACVALMEACQSYLNKHGTTGKRSPHILKVWNEAIADYKLLKKVKADPLLARALPADFTLDDLRNKGLDFKVTPSKWKDKITQGGPDNTPDSLDTMVNRGIAKAGGQGRTVPYEMNIPGENGGESQKLELLGKVDRREGPKGEVAYEYEVYKQIYEAVGQHPNLAKVYGWAELHIGHDSRAEGMLMEQVPGKDGMDVQILLRDAWDDGIINSSQYFGAHQFITSRLLDVIEHLNNAGFAHNDIKPENYVINARTGEPIVIDLGGASLIGAQPRVGTKEYMDPTLYKQSRQNSDEAQATTESDLFTVGSTVAHSIEAPNQGHTKAKPNQGIMPTNRPFIKDIDAHGTITPQKNAFEYGAVTAYTSFLSDMMDGVDETDASNPSASHDAADNQPLNPIEQARQHPFLSDRSLEDTDAREVLKGVVSGEWRQRWQARWQAAGKEVPQRQKRLNQSQLTGKVKSTTKKLKLRTDHAKRFGVKDEYHVFLQEAQALQKRARFRKINAELLKELDAAIQKFSEEITNSVQADNQAESQSGDP